jgi:3-keto steroid reductase
VSPGRIIWSSSVEAIADTFSLDDIQALRTPLAYESVKRLTDVLALTHTLPSVRAASSSYFIFDGDGKKRKTRQSRALDVMPPRMYVTHPGVVASTLFPCPWWLYWAYELTIAFCRWLGSPWHTCDAYSGAKSPVWLALQDQDALDATGAERIKWGSSSNRQREVMVKPTEVDDWGWRGRVEDAANDDEGVTGVLRKAIGRRPGVEDVSEESLQEFELLGRDCWEQMEELRAEWEAILDL